MSDGYYTCNFNTCTFSATKPYGDGVISFATLQQCQYNCPPTATTCQTWMNTKPACQDDSDCMDQLNGAACSTTDNDSYDATCSSDSPGTASYCHFRYLGS